ncbi:extracellular solute-binding protein family 3 (plasmid) [Rhizobium leguminosarum bv. trifolii WSM2304]|uniref:Extracellular solute-binding protein family 3 n=1 Tax=Rhizobium leguminosarum bv. trifolii (strain WSM2304) TaxID=395492 RepID=A0ABF7QZL5_RHILW|nr:transporter substrate-binding domain-containing protein [Rhizobium leguminosarum]ACI59706.1 extracellular solute-binding protein family 3 [Rhizobium leguminosarum bv. trifolii WSM2304]
MTITSRHNVASMMLAAAGFALFAAGVASAQADCKPVSTFKTIEPGVLKIAAPDMPPFFTYKDGVMAGFEGLFFTRFAKDNCLKPEVIVLPLGGIVESVRNGLADVGGAGLNPTPERGKVVGLTHPIYYSPAVFVGKNPSGDLDSYDGKTLGTVTGFNFNKELETWGKANVKIYDTADAAFADVKSGRLPVMLLGGLNAYYRISLVPNSGLSAVEAKPHPVVQSFNSKGRTNVVHTKGNPELTDALNLAIATMRKDGTLAHNLEEVKLPADVLIPASDAGEN